MKQLTLSEIRKIQFNILSAFAKFCAQNNLKYSLCGGTLIGAVRHKGYIPWDDDIDVCMMREDYDRFLSLINDENFEYMVKSPKNCRPFPYSYTKIMDENTVLIEYPGRGNSANIYSVYIDVFPIEYLPGDINKLKKYYSNVKKLVKYYVFISQSITTKKNEYVWYKALIWTILQLMYRVKIDIWLYKKIEKIVYSNAQKDSHYIGCTIGGYGLKEVMPFDVFEKTVEIEFEECKFCAMQGYDQYLKNLYGDYMKLPPEKDRVSGHRYTAYQRDCSKAPF